MNIMKSLAQTINPKDSTSMEENMIKCNKDYFCQYLCQNSTLSPFSLYGCGFQLSL
jgi:hypothetical protein